MYTVCAGNHKKKKETHTPDTVEQDVMLYTGQGSTALQNSIPEQGTSNPEVLVWVLNKFPHGMTFRTVAALYRSIPTYNKTLIESTPIEGV